MTNSDSDGAAPGGRGRRKIFLVMTAVLVVVVLAVVGFVVLRPAKTAQATQDAEKNPAATSTPAVGPSPSASPDSGPAVNPSTTAAANTSPGTSSSTIAATGGGAGSAIADLSDTTPLQNNDMGNLSTGPEQIGTVTYQNSVGFTCDSGDDYVTAADLIYNVAGYKFLTAVFGIPSDATNAAGNTMTITFFKDGSTTQLATPITISLDHPQSVHLNLAGSSQLEIACDATSVASHSKVDMDAAMGNATIGPN